MSSIASTYEKLRDRVGALLSSDGLRASVFRGGVWLGAGSFTEQLIRFGRNMLLTRILAPQAFGTMAIVLSAATLIQVLAEIGSRDALIQNPKGTKDEYVGAAWWLSTSRGISVYALIFFSAPLISRFYGNPELAPLARIATLSILFDGLMSPRAIVAMKQMRYPRWATIQNGGGILGVLTTLVLSFFLRDVWALAIGYCSENAARFILSYVLCPYRPRFHIDRPALRDLMHFSRGMFGLALLNLIFTRADIFVLAKIFPAADLGLYSMAVYLVQTPAVFITAIMGQTLLPAMSRIQKEPARMNRVLLQATSATVMLGLPALVFIGFCGPSLLTLFYGPRYGALSGALIMAAAVSFINILNVLITIAFYATGKPQLHRRSVAAMAFVVLATVYPLSKGLGIWAGQLACLMAVIAGYLLQVERIRKVTGLHLTEYCKSFRIPAIVSLAIAGLWFATRTLGGLTKPAPSIIFGVLACLLAYGFSGAMFFRKTGEAL